MIVTFSVSNFRSFREEQTLSLVASKRIPDRLEGHSCPIPGSAERCLRTAVLYGANGAGKSNLFHALRFFRRLALRTRSDEDGTGLTPFRFETKGKCDATFDLQFIANNNLYRFGLTLDEHLIKEEWLAIVRNGRQTILYERTTSSTGNVNVSLGAQAKRFPAKLRALVEVGGRENASFLSTIRSNLKPADYGDRLKEVVEWFDNGLTLIAPDESFAGLPPTLASDADLLDFSGKVLRAFSTGINSLVVEKTPVTLEQLHALIPESVLAPVLSDLNKNENESAVVLMGGDRVVLLERGNEPSFFIQSIRAQHILGADAYADLGFGEESDGTQRLLHLAPVLHAMNSRPSAFVIDELDRSLHPILAKEFVRYFLQHCPADRRQLIVTTHESALLDQELLRRDEIWFAEKDQAGATKLYPLTEFKVRNDLELRKGYLEGRFGAIPFLGRLEDLEERKQSA